jgi:ketosteroid isomerase-like protein
MPWNYRKTLARTVFLLNSGWSYDESQMSEVRASDKTKSSRVFDGAYARHSRGKGALSGLSDCAQQGILTVQQEWLEYERNGNVTGVVSLCSDDVVWLPPNQPAMRGKNAVTGWLAALPEHRIPRIEIMNVRIYSSGELAYKLADFTTWFEKEGQAHDEFVTGSHLWVLRESSPEHWQVAVVAWSTAGPTNTA